MTNLMEMHNFFRNKGWKARIITSRKNARVLVKVDPDRLVEARSILLAWQPLGIKFEFAELNWWDRFRMGKHAVRMELR